MARRTPAERNQWANWSRMRAQGPAKIDLCKINTAALRRMTADQLQLAHTRIGWGMLPKKALTKAARAETWRKVPRKGDEINALFGRYIAALREAESPLYLSDENVAEYWRRWPRQDYSDTNEAERIRELKKERDPRREAVRIERQIWDLQVRASCPIKPREQVARDAEREDKNPEAITRLRKRAIIR